MSKSGTHHYLESGHLRGAVEGEPMRVLDGGSRGGPFAPFDRLRGGFQVVGFEPEAVPESGTIPKALWNRSGKVDVHLAEQRETSSVYPPDFELLKMFPDHIGVPHRRTESVVTVDCVSIDDAVDQGLCERPDFIKLDIHSSEYEALEGAAETLKTVVAVLVETWHLPVHKGQRLHGDVEQLLSERGFQLFDHWPVARWRHALDGKPDRRDRPMPVAAESLFFRDFSDADPVSMKTVMFAIATADLYGYTNYAVRLSRTFAERGVIPGDLQRETERELLKLRDERTPPPSRDRGVRRRVRRAREAVRDRRWRGHARLYRGSKPLFSRGMPKQPDVRVPTEAHGTKGGTYAICPDGISDQSVVYSFGVGSDLSFDLSLIERYELTVHAFDPTDESAQVVAGQDLPERFHFHQWALASSDGSRGLQRLNRPSKRYQPATLLDVDAGFGEGPTVEAFTLETIMQKLGHEHVDILKLDIEGAELPIIERLNGTPFPASQLVLEVHPHIANLEHHSLMLGRTGWKRSRDAIAALRESGFELFHVSPRGTELSFRRS